MDQEAGFGTCMPDDPFSEPWMCQYQQEQRFGSPTMNPLTTGDAGLCHSSELTRHPTLLSHRMGNTADHLGFCDRSFSHMSRSDGSTSLVDCEPWAWLHSVDRTNQVTDESNAEIPPDWFVSAARLHPNRDPPVYKPKPKADTIGCDSTWSYLRDMVMSGLRHGKQPHGPTTRRQILSPTANFSEKWKIWPACFQFVLHDSTRSRSGRRDSCSPSNLEKAGCVVLTARDESIPPCQKDVCYPQVSRNGPFCALSHCLKGFFKQNHDLREGSDAYQTPPSKKQSSCSWDESRNPELLTHFASFSSSNHRSWEFWCNGGHEIVDQPTFSYTPEQKHDTGHTRKVISLQNQQVRPRNMLSEAAKDDLLSDVDPHLDHSAVISLGSAFQMYDYQNSDKSANVDTILKGPQPIPGRRKLGGPRTQYSIVPTSRSKSTMQRDDQPTDFDTWHRIRSVLDAFDQMSRPTQPDSQSEGQTPNVDTLKLSPRWHRFDRHLSASFQVQAWEGDIDRDVRLCLSGFDQCSLVVPVETSFCRESQCPPIKAWGKDGFSARIIQDVRIEALFTVMILDVPCTTFRLAFSSDHNQRNQQFVLHTMQGICVLRRDHCHQCDAFMPTLFSGAVPSLTTIHQILHQEQRQILGSYDIHRYANRDECPSIPSTVTYKDQWLSHDGVKNDVKLAISSNMEATVTELALTLSGGDVPVRTTTLASLEQHHELLDIFHQRNFRKAFRNHRPVDGVIAVLRYDFPATCAFVLITDHAGDNSDLFLQAVQSSWWLRDDPLHPREFVLQTITSGAVPVITTIFQNPGQGPQQAWETRSDGIKESSSSSSKHVCQSFDAALCQPQNHGECFLRTITRGAVPVLTTTYQDHNQALQQAGKTRSVDDIENTHFPDTSGSLPDEVDLHQRPWTVRNAIYIGGHPAWNQSDVIHMQTDISTLERLAATSRDQGWLASDEMHFYLQMVRQRRDDVHVTPVVMWCPDRDLLTNVEGDFDMYISNRQLTLMPFLIKSHWCALEIDKRSFPPHITFVQWPQHLQTTILHKVARALQIPPHRLTCQANLQDHEISLCGWTILRKWNADFGLDDFIRLQTANRTTYDSQVFDAVQRSRRFWTRTNADHDLIDLATQIRTGFLVQHALDNPDTRVPQMADIISFAGATDNYVRQSRLRPHEQTQNDRARFVIEQLARSPAWMSSIEIEVCLRGIRLLDRVRLFPPPMRYDPDTQALIQSDVSMLSVVGYTHVALVVLLQDHWTLITLTRANHQWCAFLAVSANHHQMLPGLRVAISQFLEIHQTRLDCVLMSTSPIAHMCGWNIMYNLFQTYGVATMTQSELYERRIQYMPHAQAKLTVLELGKAIWFSQCPDQALSSFAHMIRARFLAQCDIWPAHEQIWLGGHPAQVAWEGMTARAKQSVLTTIRAHCHHNHVCPCMTRLTAYLELGEILHSDDQGASVLAMIKSSPFVQEPTFLSERLAMHSCPHTKVQQICLTMPLRYLDTIKPGLCAVLFQGQVSVQGSKVEARIGDLESGLYVFREGLEVESRNLIIGEYCSGAFSGWTQAGVILESMGFATETRYAIDYDACVASCYAANFTGENKASCPADIFRLRDECFFYKEAQIMFQSDIRFGWWLFFCEPISIATASPPCPAFSHAGNSGGLERVEGLTIVETVLKIMIARPKIMLIKEVATLKSHPHYAIVQTLFKWGGYTIVWEHIANLSEILPQSRPRLLIVAKRNDALGIRDFQCQTWGPRKSLPGMDQAYCILRDNEILQHTCPPLSGQVFKSYIDPRRIPGGTCRSQADAVRFRIKTETDQCHCILASYGYGHEYQTNRSEVDVIFGSLLRSQGQIRFLSMPELAFLQGVSVAWEGPLEARMVSHFLGNAISVPHAVLGLLNGICHFEHLAHTEFPVQLFDIALQSRLHAKNASVTIDHQRKCFRIAPLAASPTQPWPEQILKLTHLYLVQGKQTIEIWCQQHIRVLDAFRCIFRNFDLSHIGWLPFADHDTVIPCQAQDTVAGSDMHFTIPLDFQLCLDEHMFVQEVQDVALTLLSEQMILFKCEPTDVVQDLIDRLSIHLDKPIQIYNHMLHPADPSSRPRQVMIIGDKNLGHIVHRPTVPGALFDIGESLQCRMPTSNAFEFLRACQTNGTSHVMSALGWQILLRLESIPSSTEARIVILPTQSQLHVDLIAIRNVLATHLTVWFLPESVSPGPTTFAASLKLWSTIVWTGNLPRNAPADIFAVAWQNASRFTGPYIPVHTIWRGRRLTPSFSFHDYLPQELPSDLVQKFHIVGHLSGGGSKVDHAIQINRQLVTFLLQQGASSITTPKFVADLIQYAGLTRIQQVLSVPDEEIRLDQVKQTAVHYKVTLPEFADPEADRTKKLKAVTRKWKPATSEPKAAQFRLSEALFKTADDQTVANGDTSSPGNGVFLLDSTEMQQFVKLNSKKYTHCVAVCLGANCPIADSSCSVHNLPATDQQDRKVVVATCVHQLGEQKAQLFGSNIDVVCENSTTVLALTAWQAEMDDERWYQLLEAPLRTMWKNFNVEPSNTIIPKPWGRSWRDGMKATDQEHATSFQVHVRVYTTAVATLLAQSGKNGMFITPKGHQGHVADSSYALIWMKDHTREQVIALAESIEGHAGIVRSYRGKQAYGVRVPSDIYEKTLATLQPDGPKRSHMPANFFGRLSPLPHGTGFEELKTWLTTQSLKMRPIRALSSTVWLLASPDPIDSSHYLWGCNSVLLEQIDSKRQVQPTVVAGARKVVNLADHVMPQDILQSDDPWATFVPIVNTSNASSSSSARSTYASTLASKGAFSGGDLRPSRTQDDSEIQDIKKQIEVLARESKEHTQSERQLRKDLQGQIQQVRKEVKEQFETTEQSFRQTLDTRIHHLEQSITKTQSDLQLGFKEVLSRLAKPDPSEQDSSKRKKGDNTMDIDS